MKRVWKRKVVKPYVEWYLQKFGDSKSKEMYNYAENNDLFPERGYHPTYKAFKSQMIQHCLNRTCTYDQETGLWALMNQPLTAKEAFEQKFAKA